MSHSTYFAIRSGHAAYQSITHYTVIHPKRVVVNFSRIFDTHNSPHTPKWAGTTHLRHTYTPNSYTLCIRVQYLILYWCDIHWVYWTYLNTIIAYLYVSLLVHIYCTSLEWPTVTNDTLPSPPHTHFIFLAVWLVYWQFEWYAKRRSVHQTWNRWLLANLNGLDQRNGGDF